MVGSARFLNESFEQRYGPRHSPRVYRAPGRVNLIGEHTDYNLGFVMPVALDLACLTASAPAADGQLRVYSKNLEQSREWPVSSIRQAQPARDWGDYVLGVARELVLAGYQVDPGNLLVYSTIPIGSGLSSSAAIEVSVALALLRGRPMEPLELVRLCRRAENNFVGMPCGIMDQYISVFGHEGSAVVIDCRSLDHQVAALPPEADLVAVNTMVRHELGGSAYRNRVAECAAAVAAVRRKYPQADSLRDVSVEMLAEFAGRMDPVAMCRARHVVTENARVEAFAAASRTGDLERMGDLLGASHRSLQHDYEVSCQELDFLVDTALKIPGVYGARMTGGGFGGCTVNLVDPDLALQFQATLSQTYEERFHLVPEMYPCRPSAGAGEVSGD
ncbi:MAG TPA: galactokinase, partial [Bryobacteraceae bacterium]|nr:galactokinase [Bryobacteraceae bacterium]